MRSMIVAAVVLLVATAGAGSAIAAEGARSSQRPVLTLIDRSPLTIAGAQFRPGELVRIAVRGAHATQRRIRAGRSGGFQIVLQAWILDRCGTPVVIEAIGIRSGAIAVKPAPQPACPPPLAGPQP